MASTYLELPLRSVGSISAPGIASEATLQALLAELELKANLNETQPVSISQTQTGSFSEDLTLSTTAETITAPVGAFACFIETDETNTTNARVKMGAVATTTSGIQFQGGRSEFYQGGSNISVCMESGTGKISVQWFVRS